PQAAGGAGGKNTFVICEICDGYIKDLEQLRNHMQWIHKVKIHPKMIYNRPPLNCQKCQFRFFTDQGLERHLLGSHGLVTSSMQEAANKGKDGGRCPVCGRVYQWKLLNHVARDHNMSLKPAHLSYKCTVCTATFGMYRQFENHVYSAHSVAPRRPATDKKPQGQSTDPMLKPLKINDEITIIPQPPRPTASSSSSTSSSNNNKVKITPVPSKK
ncbi:MOG interacting and ectopic P-granules protein 1-like, partial [Diaphorina citri]|uniref:MOG interacting and ectopic P-granules protein 1 n=1 Tax=Diaphorina citri TaxID=121845 RepID=A0A1S3DMK9_DIACI